MRTCVFAGTFDPITKGHEKVVKTCLNLFDEVVVAVGVNGGKNPLFSRDERLKLVEKTFENETRVKVSVFDGLLVDFMRENGYVINMRGVRNVDDYKYETEMFLFNTDMYPELQTVYIPAGKDSDYVSSSALRSLYKAGGDLTAYLPSAIVDLATEMLKRK